MRYRPPSRGNARLAVFAAAVVTLLSGCSDPCTNSVLERMSSPSGGREAVVYIRACGATTGPSTNVAVLPSQGVEPNGVGNALVLKDPVSMSERSGDTRIRWVSADTLEVSYLAGRSVQSSSSSVENTTVVLVTRPN